MNVFHLNINYSDLVFFKNSQIIVFSSLLQSCNWVQLQRFLTNRKPLNNESITIFSAVLIFTQQSRCPSMGPICSVTTFRQMLLHPSQVFMLPFNGQLDMHTWITSVSIAKDTKHIRKTLFLKQIII